MPTQFKCYKKGNGYGKIETKEKGYVFQPKQVCDAFRRVRAGRDAACFLLL